MSTKCSIRCLGSHSFPAFSVTEVYFIELLEKKDTIIKATAFEENFQILIENYLEFEKSLLCYSVDGMLLEVDAINKGSDNFHNFNRLLLNLLSTARFYIDFVTRNLDSFELIEPGIKQDVGELIHKQYDDRLGYRVMEALRNYSQHYGLPLQGVYLNFDATSKEDRRVWRHRTVPVILVSTLMEDRTFKRSVLKELSALGESFSILPFLRDYVAGIWEVHAFLRKRLSIVVKIYSEFILDSIASSAVRIGEDCKGFLLFRTDEDTGEHQRIEIFNGVVERINRLIAKNTIFPCMEFRYVSNESLPGDK